MIEPKGMVFRNEHETNGEKWYSYTYSVSGKDRDGNWENAPKPIKFWSEIAPPGNMTRIKLIDAWEKPMKWKGELVPGWFVKEYEVIQSGESVGEPGGFTAIVDDDIPF